MAEQRSAPTVPPQPWFDPKTGNATEAFRRYLIGEGGRISNVNSGTAELLAAQQAAEANAAAAIAAANQAAAAAVAAGGSTETDYDTASFGVNSGTFATVLTNDLNHAGGGNYTITAVLQPALVITSSSILSTGTSFSGEWRVIENPNAHVLASGTFTVLSEFQGGEGGAPFYSNSVTFGTDMPFEDSFGDNESGAVTIELQLRRASGTNDVSGLYASMLTEWA